MSKGPAVGNNYGEDSESFEVAHCPQLGRYLKATRDILKGEIIFQEFPITLAPQKQSILICPGCFEIPDPDAKCKQCGWPICGENCPKLSTHKAECDAFKLKDDYKNTEGWISIQDTLMLFRCLRLKYDDQEKWQGLMGMASNWEKWSKSSSLVGSAQELIDKLRRNFEMQFEESEPMKVLAILDTNAYEVKMPSVNVQGCYQKASLAEHTCVPNAFKTTSSKTFLLTMRALTDIPKGSHIATSYCDILWPTFQRQRHIQWSKFFTCRCPRCTDTTELQTYISSFLCPHCPPVTPLLPSLTVPKNAVIEEDKEEEDIWTNTSKDYTCGACGSLFAASKCESFMVSAERELQDLESTFSEDTDKQDINEALEHWLEKWTIWPAASSMSKCYMRSAADQSSSFNNLSQALHRSRVKYCITPLVYLHPQHALSLDACHSLFFSYSCDSSETDVLARKCDLGMHLLRATKPFFNNGISLFRGTIMYELGMTKAGLFAIHVEDHDRQGVDLKMLADETLALLQESLGHLQYEADDQPEGKLFVLGVKQLEKLRRFFEEVLPTL